MPKDRLGYYFTCFREATGHSTTLAIEWRDEDGQTRRLTFDHENVDGFAAISQIENLSSEAPSFPKKKIPSLTTQLSLVFSHLRLMKSLPRPQLSLDLASSESLHSFRLQSLEESRHINQTCKTLGVTATSYLIWTLHRALGKHKGKENFTCPWSLPINLRGAGAIDTSVGNQSVPIFFGLTTRHSARDIHELIRTRLHEGHHWGLFRLLTTLSYLPRPLYRWLIRRDEEKALAEGKWFAVLSNLGVLKSVRAIEPNSVIIATNPGAPLKCLTFRWNDRWFLAVNVHSSLSEQPDELLETWIDEMQRTLS